MMVKTFYPTMHRQTMAYYAQQQQYIASPETMAANARLQSNLSRLPLYEQTVAYCAQQREGLRAPIAILEELIRDSEARQRQYMDTPFNSLGAAASVFATETVGGRLLKWVRNVLTLKEVPYGSLRKGAG